MRPFLQGQLGQLQLPMLYDTGSSITCISEQVFRRLPPDSRPHKQVMPVNSMFQTAGGQNLRVRGLYNMPLKILDKTISHPVYVISDLNEQGILGIDFINKNGLNYNPQRQGFHWEGDQNWFTGSLRNTKEVTIAALSSHILHTNMISEYQHKIEKDNLCIATITNPERPWLMGGPALVMADSNGQCHVEIFNSTPAEIIIKRNEFIGIIENIKDEKCTKIEMEKIHAIAQENRKSTHNTLTPEHRKYILANANLNVPASHKLEYEKLLLKHHNVFSKNKNDLGRSDLIQHEIHLKTSNIG